MKFPVVSCCLGDFRTGVFIQLQPFRYAGNWCVDEGKRGEREGGKEEEEGRGEQKGVEGSKRRNG